MALNNKSFAKEKISGEFTVPDYYKDFTCKGGDCRDSCCNNWKVTISMSQYFMLHGLSCSKKVKEKIDRTFRPVYQPTTEKYAEIVHNQDGDCPLHKENGYCLLHESCGEEVLPWVCRYYPRGPRVDYAYEASCSNSCERTLELLFLNDDKITFEKKILSFLMNKPKNPISEESKTNYHQVRENIFTLLSNRDHLLNKRLVHLGIYIKALENNPNISLKSVDFNYIEPEQDIINNYQFLWRVLDNFNGSYPRLKKQLDQAKSLYEENDIAGIYNKVRERFEILFPNHEILFEKLLINDLFFKQFPFQTNFTLWNQYIAICGIYVLLRYLTINLMYELNTTESLIDILSKTFTVISHSEFDRQIAGIFAKEGVSNVDKVAKITQI